MFTETADVWKQTAELKGSDTECGDSFGWSVAVSGITALVGASGHAKDAARAYVFTKMGGTWKQTTALKGSDSVGYDAPLRDEVSGWSVAVSGVRAVVSGQGHAKDTGRVHVFQS